MKQCAIRGRRVLIALTRVSRFRLVNSFLLVEADGVTVIDTMIPGSADSICAAAARLGKPITRIALTHAHGDHVGSLDALVAVFPAAEVIISAREGRLLGRDLTLDPGEPEGKLRTVSYPGAKTAPTRTVTHGDRVGSLEVIASPGHTPGHVCFLDTRDRTLFCGDAYSALGSVATSAKSGPWVSLIALGGWDRPTALQSARALRDLEPARLAPGHGRVINSPGRAMDKAIARST